VYIKTKGSILVCLQDGVKETYNNLNFEYKTRWIRLNKEGINNNYHYHNKLLTSLYAPAHFNRTRTVLLADKELITKDSN